MKALHLKLVSILGLFALLLIVMPSCRKEGDTIAIITVVDTSGARIPGATVILYGTPSSPDYAGLEIIRKDTQFTDAVGQATFNYTEAFKLGQAGFAVLDIKAIKDTLEGSGIIKVEEEVTSEETVIIQPQ